MFLHAPAFGELAQRLGGYCRYNTSVSPRLAEFAILVTAKLWRAQYEWFAHVPQAERAGVKPSEPSAICIAGACRNRPQGRARDLRFHPGALQDETRERQEFQARQCHPRRRRNRRIRRHPRLLRADLHGPQRFSHVAARERAVAVCGRQVMQDRIGHWPAKG